MLTLTWLWTRDLDDWKFFLQRSAFVVSMEKSSSCKNILGDKLVVCHHQSKLWLQKGSKATFYVSRQRGLLSLEVVSIHTANTQNAAQLQVE